LTAVRDFLFNYSHLSFLSGGRLTIHNSRTRHTVATDTCPSNVKIFRKRQIVNTQKALGVNVSPATAWSVGISDDKCFDNHKVSGRRRKAFCPLGSPEEDRGKCFSSPAFRTRSGRIFSTQHFLSYFHQPSGDSQLVSNPLLCSANHGFVCQMPKPSTNI
jgi:hypothetical protein